MPCTTKELKEENEELRKKLEEEKEKGKARKKWFRGVLEKEGRRYDMLDISSANKFCSRSFTDLERILRGFGMRFVGLVFL
ncbi:23076_t:CDS:2, partial [Dentiscutata erythropus]